MHTIEEGSSENLAPVADREFVSLNALSKLTGFPIDMINKELLSDDEIDLVNRDGLSLDDLRQRICKFVDRVFLD